ncbi:F0F1 ATP synthase subunit A [Marisediminicola antarctica]|uniref:ATP synthase subunit a n=1 Tax=Marisediminicola antarctica TaxID=674079 RepID=A0A7L5AGI6_9MICO|nr:F0F1 ATP synthase subunit A [Marisediminicola antarctica]QHO69648.1 ATP synthase F0 subunit A [Marisediminicola antarctica]
MALLLNALNSVLPFATDGESEEGVFVGPSIAEFFPEAVLFVGTPFEMNRIMMIRIVVLLSLMLFFYLATRRMSLIPSRAQSIAELGLGLVRVNIAEDLLGKKDAARFLPLLTTFFFLILGMNITGIVPAMNIAGTSVIGIPLLLAVVAYVVFIYAGLKKHPVAFLRNSLFPPGVPWPLYIIVTPIEFVSTFVLRPITLTLRLVMNMIVGHLLLVLFFLATSFFFFEVDGVAKLFGVGTLAFGFVFTLFEILVAVLQAYVFTLLTTVYIQLALADEH